MPPTANGSFPLSLIVKFLKCASETSGKEYAHLLFGALSNSFYVRNKTIKTKTQKLMEFKFVLLWNFFKFWVQFWLRIFNSTVTRRPKHKTIDDFLFVTKL